MKSFSEKTKKFEYHEVSEMKEKKILKFHHQLIRNLIREGKIVEANKFLLRNWSISSIIINGKKMVEKLALKLQT